MTPQSEIARLLALLADETPSTPEQIAEAEAALAVEPKHPQQALPL